jgi:hypothetical protein
MGTHNGRFLRTIKIAAAAKNTRTATTMGTTIEAVEPLDLVDATPISQVSPWKPMGHIQNNVDSSSIQNPPFRHMQIFVRKRFD